MLFVFLSPKPALLEGIPFSTAYYDRDGKLLRLSLAKDQSYRLYTKLENISQDLIKATLTQEDRYFFYHPGVNPFSLLRGAFETYVRRSRFIGGSTITMQLVRLRDGFNTRSIGGKLLQIVKAMQLEAHYSKKDILEAYLNLAPYGGNIYGAETASFIYFKQPIKSLAMPQSLSLAVIPQNPVKRFPLRADNSQWHIARNRLFEKLPQEDYERYAPFMEMELTVSSRHDLPFLAPHFLDGLKKQGHNNMVVPTTLDSKVQGLLEQHVSAYLERHKAHGFDNAAAMIVHFPTMEIRALSGSADFFNKTIDGQVDGTLARRSPGSTLKPFVYALALEQGLIHPETLLKDEPTFIAEYRPGNFDKHFIGVISARDALVFSRNIPAISLAQKLEEPDLYAFLQRAGAAFPKGKQHYGLSIVVGGAEIAMRDLVRFYAMLANGGVLQDLRYLLEIKRGSGQRFLSAESALLTLNMLKQPIPGSVLPFSKSTQTLPVYWKTGTSNGFRDAWTVGVFGPYVLAVWVGHFDGHSNSFLVGSKAATPLFFDIVKALHEKENLTDYIKPAMEQTNLATVSICPKTGALTRCDISKESWFIPGKSPFSLQGQKIISTEILSPRENISYSYSYKKKEKLYIPLEAKNNDVHVPLYWFANNEFLGATKNREPLFWSPVPGIHTVRVVDEQGHADSRNIKVIVSE